MSAITTSGPSHPLSLPPELRPKIDHLVTEDDQGVDNIFSERQMRLLVSALYDSWSGPTPDPSFVALANVGLSYSLHVPPIVPDVLLSLGVKLPADPFKKAHRSYFLWEYGKAPEVIFEIVSNKEGGELTDKLAIYKRLGIWYYVVWDPEHLLGEKDLHCFARREGNLEENGLWLKSVGLGLQRWEGTYEGFHSIWLRWCDGDGNLLLTGAEKADQEKQRADKLAARLRTMGVDPDED